MSHNPINRILINGTQREEIRIALTSDKFLDDLFIQSIDQQPTTGNIYLAKVSRVVPSLQAAFVDYGAERHGFLPLKEIAPQYYKNPALSQSQEYINISDVLNEGQVMLVQVEKEERGNKGAALTSFITLAGCYLVLMPNNADAGGISRRVEGDERDQLKELLSTLQYPHDMGLIIRTAGVGKAIEELQWDLDVLLKLWSVITQAEQQQNSPCLIHQESDIIIRALRDYLRKDIHEIIVDTPQFFEQARNHLATVYPEIDIVKFYDDPAIPLFTRYHIENQIETAFQRDVRLPSGGYIVIQETEALVSIDVNSARDTKSGDIELTAFNTNREAAIEVARQLRLRDLGGLIVIDFIDMNSADNQQQIVDTFKNEIRHDKARVQYSRISRFGLLEVSRQRLRPSLKEGSQIVCPRCSGQGSIRSVESLALLLLRLLRQEAMQPNVSEVHVQVPVEVATFLMNEKRSILSEIEHHQRVMLRILPNPYMETPQYKIERVYENQTSQQGKASYEHLAEANYIPPATRVEQATKTLEPVVKGIETPVKPIVKQAAKASRLGQVLKGLFGKIVGHSEPEETQQKRRGPQRHRRQGGGHTSRQRAPHPHAQNPQAQQAQTSTGSGRQGNRRGRGTQGQHPRHAQTGNHEATSRTHEHRRESQRQHEHDETRSSENRSPRQPRHQGQDRRSPRAPRQTERSPVETSVVATPVAAPVIQAPAPAPVVRPIETPRQAPTSSAAPTQAVITPPAALEVKPGLYTSQPSALAPTTAPVSHPVIPSHTDTSNIAPPSETAVVQAGTEADDKQQRHHGQRRPHSRNRYRRQHRSSNQTNRDENGVTDVSKTTTEDESTS